MFFNFLTKLRSELQNVEETRKECHRRTDGSTLGAAVQKASKNPESSPDPNLRWDHLKSTGVVFLKIKLETFRSRSLKFFWLKEPKSPCFFLANGTHRMTLFQRCLPWSHNFDGFDLGCGTGPAPKYTVSKCVLETCRRESQLLTEQISLDLNLRVPQHLPFLDPAATAQRVK